MITDQIEFQKLDKREPIPYSLLLLADPSRKIVDSYINSSDIYTAKIGQQTVGVIVLLTLTDSTIEIKNVAVKFEFQQQGIGSLLIKNAIRIAGSDHQKTLCIGTANSSTRQLYLYQKLGFEISEIRMNYFKKNYTEPIYEQGIQAKHLLVLTMQIPANHSN
ncbi:MAG: GNAT family N-acetyltransferase [Balneolales bacterium]|nr:GNAT family N-acetyltransferase [Balneolales bacterium]